MEKSTARYPALLLVASPGSAWRRTLDIWTVWWKGVPGWGWGSVRKPGSGFVRFQGGMRNAVRGVGNRTEQMAEPDV